MQMDDPRIFALSAGLAYVDPSQPGITRRRCGKGFTYVLPNGELLKRGDERRNRVEALVIPPAWQRVWVCTLPNGHLQATGYDTRDRKQYRYHDLWESTRRSWRFARLAEFARTLPRIRRHVKTSLQPGSTSHDAVHAASVRILDALALRVGNQTSVALAESYGLTTLQVGHARVGKKNIRFSFIGKGGTEIEVSIQDPLVASILDAAGDIEDDHLLSYEEHGRIGHVSGASLRAWLKEAAGAPVTGRMFRTWRATVEALEGLRKADWGEPSASAVIDVLTPVALRLGHTVATCRTYYVHESIEPLYLSGGLADYDERSVVRGLSVAEQRALALVDAHAEQLCLAAEVAKTAEARLIPKVA